MTRAFSVHDLSPFDADVEYTVTYVLGVVSDGNDTDVEDQSLSPDHRTQHSWKHNVAGFKRTYVGC